MWELQQPNVAIKINQHGRFTVKKTGSLYSIKLVHRSGTFDFTDDANITRKSYWARLPGPALRFIITRINRVQLLPTKDKMISKDSVYVYYVLPGFNGISPFIALHSILDPIAVTAGEELQIWHLDAIHHTEKERYSLGYSSDSGITADVFAIIL